MHNEQNVPAQKRLDESASGVSLLFDADHFKCVNDVYGHSAGDICIVEIAHRMKWNLRAHDVAGRLGGEEFAVFLAGATIEQARATAGRLGQPIPYRGNVENGHQTTTLSMGGIVIVSALSLDAHLIRADEVLYMVKDAGCARLVMWRAGINPSLEPRETGRNQTAAA